MAFLILFICHCPCDADPYLNTDAGTMSPFEHGEVFVLDDGGEVAASPSPLARLTALICTKALA
jgi:CTP synthase